MGILQEVAGNIHLGMSVALSATNLFYCFIGVLLGTLVGILPGIGALAALSLLLPVTFHLDPTAAVVMLAGVFYGASYGGSTASILLNLPGTPSSAIACLDGYPMSKQGRAGVALFMTTIASFIGGTIGIIIMMIFSPYIVGVALRFGAPEYFSMMVFGLIASATISSGSALKGVCMVLLGVAFGLVGADLETGMTRYTFGLNELYSGFSLVAIAMGLFGVAEVIYSIQRVRTGHVDPKSITFRSMVPTRNDMRRSIGPILRGAGVGSFFGTLPGTGGVLAAFMAYTMERRVSKRRKEFGNGAIEGVVAPEAANNAADQTAFIPTLTLGIPGNVVMALMIGALMIHGITPGPRLMGESPDLFWGLVMSFWIGNLFLLILNIPLIGIWIRILAIPYYILFPCILVFICLGVYSVNNSIFEIVLVLFFGVLGFVLKKLEFEPAPLLLGFYLGPLVEANLRRALLISRGDFWVFLERPISLTFLVLSAFLVLWVLSDLFRKDGSINAGTQA